VKVVRGMTENALKAKFNGVLKAIKKVRQNTRLNSYTS